MARRRTEDTGWVLSDSWLGWLISTLFGRVACTLDLWDDVNHEGGSAFDDRVVSNADSSIPVMRKTSSLNSGAVALNLLEMATSSSGSSLVISTSSPQLN